MNNQLFAQGSEANPSSPEVGRGSMKQMAEMAQIEAAYMLLAAVSRRICVTRKQRALTFHGSER